MKHNVETFLEKKNQKIRNDWLVRLMITAVYFFFPVRQVEIRATASSVKGQTETWGYAQGLIGPCVSLHHLFV